MKNSSVLITGVAGFIGMHVALRLLADGVQVIGIDNLCDYYDPKLKLDRINQIERHGGQFTFLRCDFSDHEALAAALKLYEFDTIVHLGAQAGVRYSIENPRAYVQANLVGHLNILELARSRKLAHLVYASSSSVYGQNKKVPFNVDDRVDHPVSLYAATKKSDELLSESYAHLFRLPMTGLRFFTVYGPWGRPDMAPWLFTEAILTGRPIDVFNQGRMRRDFTYVDDIVSGVLATLHSPPIDNGARKPGGSTSPHAIYNIGNNQSEELARFIDVTEQACGRKAEKNMMDMQQGDVPVTYADIDELTRDHGYKPTTTIDVGMPLFVNWLRGYKGF
jgi:UDP-glucuronate 4-epimerase